MKTIILLLMPIAAMAQPGAVSKDNPVPIDSGLLALIALVFGLYLTTRPVKWRRIKRFVLLAMDCLADYSRTIAATAFSFMIAVMLYFRQFDIIDLVAIIAALMICTGITIVDHRFKKRKDVYQIQKDSFNKLLNEAKKRDEARQLKDELRKKIELKVEEAERKRQNLQWPN